MKGFTAATTKLRNSLPVRLFEKPTCHTPGSGGRWRHFYSDSPTTEHCELY